MTAISDEIQGLLTATIDARNGYTEALKDSKDPDDLVSLFREMAAMHERHASELSRMLVGMSIVPDEKPSVMSFVHSTIMDIRSALGGLDKSVLPGLIDGEERNEKKYNETSLKAVGADADAVLVAQQADLAEAIGEMRRMAG